MWKGLIIVGIWSAVAVMGFLGGYTSPIAVIAMVGTFFCSDSLKGRVLWQ